MWKRNLEPNTQDREFIKGSEDGESDSECELTNIQEEELSDLVMAGVDRENRNPSLAPQRIKAIWE